MDAFDDAVLKAAQAGMDWAADHGIAAPRGYASMEQEHAWYVAQIPSPVTMLSISNGKRADARTWL